MKRVTKVLALILAAVTLLSVMTIPTFAAYNYPMTCTVYYKNEKGEQIASPVTFTVNAAHSDASSVGVSSPSISGYVLKDSNDSYVTYEMMDKSFPASNYVRQGTATYTVVYTDTVYHYLYFVNGSTRRTIAPSATLKGTPGTYYNHIPPTVTHYTPGRTSVSGRFSGNDRLLPDDVHHELQRERRKWRTVLRIQRLGMGLYDFFCQADKGRLYLPRVGDLLLGIVGILSRRRHL